MGTAQRHHAVTITLSIATILILAAVKLASVPTDGIERYPYMIPIDSWEWLSQALSYLGEPVTRYHRPPLLAGLLAALYRSGIERFAGYIPQAASFALALAMFLLARRTAGTAAGAVAAAIVIANKQCFAMSYHLNPDLICLALMTFSLVLLYEEGPVARITAWFLAAAVFYAQNAFFFIVPFVATAIAVDGRRFMTRTRDRAGLVLYAIVIAAYFPLFFDFSESYGRHFSELSLSPSKLGFMTSNLLTELSWPGVVLLAIGLWSGFTSPRMRRSSTALAVWFATTFVFFTFILRGETERYVMYAKLPLLLFVASAVASLAARAPSGMFGGLLVIVVLFFQNLSTTTDAARIGSRQMPLLPGLAYSHERGTVAEITTIPASLFFLWTSPADAYAVTNLYSHDPETTLKTAQALASSLERNASFSVSAGKRYLVNREGLKLEVLARRRFTNEVRPETAAIVAVGDVSDIPPRFVRAGSWGAYTLYRAGRLPAAR